MPTLYRNISQISWVGKKNLFSSCSQASFVLEKKFKKYFCLTQIWFIQLWKVKNFSKKFFFQFSKSMFFLKIEKNSLDYFDWNFSWSSILRPENLSMRIVWIGFKNRQKMFFVSLKKHQNVDYLRRFWLFFNFLFWFEFLFWR